MKRKMMAWVTSAAICLSMSGTMISNAVESVSAAGAYRVEYLDRGISAISTGSGMLVSWRFLASDSDDTVFQLYRNNTQIATSNAGEATCYVDADGSSSDTYRIDTVVGGNVTSSDTCRIASDANYMQLNLNPPTSSNCTYSPNDCSVGDVDGDGQYEIFLKWDPSTSKDNSQGGKTDKVYIDCYRLDGTQLWRIDLGYNIRAGAHYTQFLVADFDSDGKAEMTCKTADGTKDGVGNIIGDSSATYRNSKGYILTGAEYYTLFDGATGEALDTVDYEPARGKVSSWGDSYGNRVDRFLGSVVYLDGVHPSAVTARGYYTRMTACAYDVVDKKLVKRWYFDTNDSANKAAYGCGNHNCMPADVDGDGKQELILGATCIDDDGSLKWSLGTGHGDAMHLGDLLPNRDGLELWICHEDKPYGVSLVDANSGSIIFHENGDSDTGRCCADNVWSGNDGAEFWGLSNNVYDGGGNLLSCRRPAINFLSYWDGDLEREILDGYTDSPATISKMNADGKLTTLLSTDGYYTCNTTKGTPCLSADLYGDWREELIVRGSDSKSIRIYSTTYDTDYRIQTLMQDPQYRMQVSAQNTAYNQPPHASFYLGSEEPLPEYTAVTVPEAGATAPITRPTAAVLPEGAVFTLQNVNSGLYLEAADGAAANGTNLQQGSTDSASAKNTWRVQSAGGGYYYLYSQLGNKITYLMDVTGAYSANGTNIGIWSASSRDAAQKFLFSQNEDGSYTIYTAASDLASCVEVADASKEIGANVQEWEDNGNACQHWILTQTMDTGCEIDTTKIYQIQNFGSQLFMEVQDGKTENGANVQQWGANGSAKHNSWTFQPTGNGYYTIASQLSGSETWYLTIDEGKSASGTNASIWTPDQTSAQLFKLVANADGTYYILTKSSKDNCGVAISDASTANGGNVIQMTINGNAAQKWLLTAAGTIPVETTTTTVVTTEPTTTVSTTATTITTKATTKDTVATTAMATTVSTSKVPDSSETKPTTQTTPAVTTTGESTTTTATTKISHPETSTITVDTLYGDINLDGKVELTDAVLLNKAVSGTVTLNAQAMQNADCYSNVEIDGNDALALLRFLVHLQDSLPQLP